MPAHIHLGVHFIWSTNHREPRIDPRWRNDLYAYFHGIAENIGCQLLIAGGVEDHVHLYVSMPATITLAEVVNALKSNSSRWIHENHDAAFAWQTKYAAFSVSKSQEGRLFDYIRNQEEHHRAKSFQEEYLTFLAAHQMEYDPAFAFE